MNSGQLSFFGDPGDSSLKHESELRRLPKIDLHRHLLGSVSFDTFLNMARQLRIDLPTQDETRLRELMTISSPVPGLKEFFRPWKYLSRLQTTPESVNTLATDVISQAVTDKIAYMELRLTWGITGREAFTTQDYLAAVARAATEAENRYGIITKVIMGLTRHIFGRHQNPHRDRLWTNILRAAKQFQNSLVVGFDVSGIEDGYPAGEFKAYLSEAQQEGFKLTVHAGETTDSRAMSEVLDSLKPNRIGHGLAAGADSSLRQRLRSSQIPLEICPTVNVLTSTVKNYREHPMKVFFSEEVPVVIGTDNPARCDTSLSHEMAIVAGLLEMDYSSMSKLNRKALSFAFADQVTIDHVRKRLDNSGREDRK